VTVKQIKSRSDVCATPVDTLHLFCSLAGYVELLCTKLGQPVPDLTPDQLDLNKSRIYANLVSTSVSYAWRIR